MNTSIWSLRRIGLFVCLGLVIGVVYTNAATSDPQSKNIHGNKDEMVKQITTVYHMNQLADGIRVRISIEGNPPVSLSELIHEGLVFEDPEIIVEYTIDGWGNPIYYYTNGQSFVLVSFGRNGRPDPQQSKPGHPTEETDYDSDIVWITDWWAQTPLGVDR